MSVNTSQVAIPRQSQPEGVSDTYARVLLVKKFGYPLWIPEPSDHPPEYKREGTSIGDVGVITPDGQFKFLFNIFLPGTHPLNHPPPPSFESLESYENAIVRMPLMFPPGRVIASESIEERDLNTQSEPRGIE
jgi:hypothetical protein